MSASSLPVVVGLTTEQQLEREKRRRKAAEEKATKLELQIIQLSAEKIAAVDAEEEETIRWMTNYNILKESSQAKIEGLQGEVAELKEENRDLERRMLALTTTIQKEIDEYYRRHRARKATYGYNTTDAEQ